MFDYDKNTFVRRCVEGEVSPDHIDDFIDEWHDGGYDGELHEFLGMTRKEYSEWVANPEVLSRIVDAHIVAAYKKKRAMVELLCGLSQPDNYDQAENQIENQFA